MRVPIPLCRLPQWSKQVHCSGRPHPANKQVPGDHGVQFAVKMADLLRRRMRQEAAAFWASDAHFQFPFTRRFADVVVKILAQRPSVRFREPFARFGQAHVVLPLSGSGTNERSRYSSVFVDQ